MTVTLWILLVLVAFVAGAAVARNARFGAPPLDADVPRTRENPAAPPPVGEPMTPLEPPIAAPPEPPSPPAAPATIYDIAARVADFYQASSHPRDLAEHPPFLEGVAMLTLPAVSDDDLFMHFRRSNPVLACMALEALARREGPDPFATLLDGINAPNYWVRWFALRALAARARGAVVAAFLVRMDTAWGEPILLATVRNFIAQSIADGESPVFGTELERLTPEQGAWLQATLAPIAIALPDAMIAELKTWNATRIDVAFLRSFGRVWRTGDALEGSFVEYPSADASVADIAAALRRTPPRSSMIVGEPGAGKTSIVRMLARGFVADGWTVFEASAADLLSGQMYIGQLEERVKTTVENLRGRNALWVIPNVQEMVWAGRHQHSPSGALDLILPHVESGALKVIAESTAAAYEQLVQQQPRVRDLFHAVRIEPLGDDETMDVARRWVAQHSAAGAPPRAGDVTLREALQLAKQYLGDKAPPGNVLGLLNAARGRAERRVPSGNAITTGDLLETLSEMTGLPTAMLDDSRALDPAALRAFFAQRVLGQPEAVDTLVERVAMIKAGVTDPTRPAGVFLFVGPTGTGKTEIAKALAEFLFGSPDRMIRLDMSELQSIESLDRILGERGTVVEGTALVNHIRKQPFSVVLLDEFEKAHPNIWDLFLQLFDDGRLTDRRGDIADFRHCIVIMTSNLGATIAAGSSIGFGASTASGFAGADVEKAVAQSFRREFINRLDRVVVFHPLGRGVMRELLRKELHDVLLRRGLRNRAWAVEWEESAIDFLLQKGFSADLGARPLKRAVERYLLAPLAMAIVNHQYPEGDQFLFVRSGGAAIEVEFIDPDAADSALAGLAEPSGEMSLEELMLDARGTAAEVRYIEREHDAIAALVRGDAWQLRKSEALTRMSSSGFWSSRDRFATLGLAEYMDRIEVGLETAGSLLGRLTKRTRGADAPVPRELVERIAQQLYLVDEACEGLASGLPRDAFVSVRASRDPGADAAVSDAFARRLATMYRRWAEKRRMQMVVLEDGATAGEPYRCVLAVSGFAAFGILESESGVHVLETPQDEKSFNRARATVKVAPQPDAPAGDAPNALRAQALGAVDVPNEGAPLIVRRYREEPSPLVRDGVRQWRTGRLDRVMDGDFDLF
ncbi:MAG: AAA family ATPase [Gemmatimonadaceae bacterium]